MAAKLKVIKTLNEFNILSSQQTLGNKFGVIVFFNGENAAKWKQQMSELNDLAGDFFDHASFIGVDVRFFPQVVEQHKGGENKVTVFKHGGASEVVPLDIGQIRAALKK